MKEVVIIDNPSPGMSPYYCPYCDWEVFPTMRICKRCHNVLVWPNNLKEQKMAKTNAVKIIDKTGELNIVISQQLREFEILKQQIDAKEDQLKEAIKAAMIEKGIDSFDNEYVRITLVKETVRESFDSARFKAEKPNEYKKFIKTSSVSASVRIKAKVLADE